MITIIIIPPVALADKAESIKKALIGHFGTRMVSEPDTTSPTMLKLTRTPEYSDNTAMAKIANDIANGTTIIVLEHNNVKQLDSNKVITATVVPEETLK